MDKNTLVTTRFVTPERGEGALGTEHLFAVGDAQIYFFARGQLRGVDRETGEVSVYADALQRPHDLLMFRPEIGAPQLYWLESHTLPDERFEYRLWSADPAVASSGDVVLHSAEQSFGSLSQHGGFWLMYLREGWTERSTIVRFEATEGRTGSTAEVAAAPHLERVVSTGTHAIAVQGASASRVLAFPAFR